MTMDKRGVPITADSDEAIRHFEAAVDAYLGFGLDTGEHLKAALGADPDFAMGHIARGCFFKLFALPALEKRARQALEAAEASITARGAYDHERDHACALSAWCDGDWRRAADNWERILLDHPTDVLALRLAHYTHFYSGDPRRMRDSAARVLPAWSEATPGVGFVHGMYAFGLEECSDFPRAEEQGRRAVDHNRGDIWAAHAVAHVMEMRAATAKGSTGSAVSRLTGARSTTSPTTSGGTAFCSTSSSTSMKQPLTFMTAGCARSAPTIISTSATQWLRCGGSRTGDLTSAIAGTSSRASAKIASITTSSRSPMRTTSSHSRARADRPRPICSPQPRRPPTEPGARHV